MITFHIITLFPGSLSYLEHSIIGRAQKNKKIKVKIYTLRDFALDKHQTTDDRPYGGGPGMVMKAEPILRAAAKAIGKKKATTIFFSPSGTPFTNTHARMFAKKKGDYVLIAGHYEGVDERVVKALRAKKFSMGPYVVSGGELPAMIFIDAIARQIPGVLGKHTSLEEGRIASGESFTRPETLTFKAKKYKVPKVLLSGNHKKIEAWRSRRQAKNIKKHI